MFFKIHNLLYQGMDGVGIVLEFNSDDLPIVQNLLPGKAAHACGKISIGDRLTRVGSQSTENKSFNQIRDLIVGPIGSRVSLSFRGVCEEYVCENLLRGPLEALDADLMLKAEVSPDSKAQASRFACLSHVRSLIDIFIAGYRRALR